MATEKKSRGPARYRDTLNLPRTSFPMKARLSEREPEILRRWQEQDIHARLRAGRRGSPPFILHDGPPYANGDIHIGHAVNKILKDFIIKLRGLDGADACYVPGWDCHGLPIELVMEKKRGKAGADPAAFRRACRAYAATQIDRQRRDFQRLGVLGDWQRPYLTMDYGTEAGILRALGRLLAQGHVYRGARPVHWCLDCASALAEAEVEYQDRETTAIDVRFEMLDTQAFSRQSTITLAEPWPVAIPVWTTTPWTLPANHAVALHPDLDYVLIPWRAAGQSCWLLLAEALLESFRARAGQSGPVRPAGRVPGTTLAGLRLQHPLYAREVPVLLSSHVNSQLGTGAVHIAPGHGWDDYLLGKRHGLPIDNPVADDGCFREDTPLLAGEHVSRASDRITTLLEEGGRLLCRSRHRHSHPHCWRHKSPLIFRATAQWFVSMGAEPGQADTDSLRGQTLAAIDQVTWWPGWGRERIREMVAGRPDWCISRQRAWGVPIALFVHRRTGELHPQSAALIEQVAQRIEQHGIEAWFQLQAEELLGAEAAEYEKVNDTLDVWFDSGVTHSTVLEGDGRLAAPADLYLEGSDQYRGWFQSSLISALAIRGQAPYRGVLTHGFTVDAQGRKMSKSRGNVVAPQDVIRELGADVLRLWVASSDYRSEMHVSREILRRSADGYRKIRNTARYLLGNLHGFDPEEQGVPMDCMVQLDRWALTRAACVQAGIRKAAGDYQFHRIYQLLYQFCIVDMSSFYLDVNKDRLYTLAQDSPARRSAQSAMLHILEALVRWLAPILSFTAEEIWQHLPGARPASVLLETWYQGLPDPDSQEAVQLLAQWRRVREVVDAVTVALERLRKQGVIGSSLEAEVTLSCDRDCYQLLHPLQERDELRFVLLASDTQLQRTPPPAPPDGGLSLEMTLPDGQPLAVTAWRSRHGKCVRCWHLRQEVEDGGAEPGLCARCIRNIDGPGEQRVFV